MQALVFEFPLGRARLFAVNVKAELIGLSEREVCIKRLVRFVLHNSREVWDLLRLH